MRLIGQFLSLQDHRCSRATSAARRRATAKFAVLTVLRTLTALLMLLLPKGAGSVLIAPIKRYTTYGSLNDGIVLAKVHALVYEKKPCGNHPYPGQTGCTITHYESDYGSSARCLHFCGYVPGCNAVLYCGRMGGCSDSKSAVNATIGECTLIAKKDVAAAPAVPTRTDATDGTGFLSAVILGPPLPAYCAGLHRHACEACAASKDPAGCAECTRRAANEPSGDRTGPGEGRWKEVRGAPPLLNHFKTHIGCARCVNESAAPGICAECLRTGPSNSTCWSCVMQDADNYGVDDQRPDEETPIDINACVTCARKHGWMWAESCKVCTRPLCKSCTHLSRDQQQSCLDCIAKSAPSKCPEATLFDGLFWISSMESKFSKTIVVAGKTCEPGDRRGMMSTGCSGCATLPRPELVRKCIACVSNSATYASNCFQCTQGYHNRYNPRDMDQCFDCVVSAAQAKSPAEDRCADCIIARGFVGEGNRAFLEKCLKGD